MDLELVEVDSERTATTSHCHITQYSIHRYESLSIGVEELERLANFEGTDDMYWVSIADPTREVLDTLCSAFRVHPISEEVLTKPEEATERVARFGSYLHLTLCERTRTGYNVSETRFLHFLLFRQVLISVHHGDSQLMTELRHAAGNIPSETLQHDWVLYKAVDASVDALTRDVSAVANETAAIDNIMPHIGLSGRAELLTRFSIARREVMRLNTLLLAKREVISVLQSDASNISPTTRPYILEVRDQIEMLLHKLQFASAMLHNLQSMHVSLLSLQMAINADVTNNLLKKFGALATIITLQLLITSIFSMNTTVPGALWDPPEFWFWLVITACLATLFISIALFRYIRWL